MISELNNMDFLDCSDFFLGFSLDLFLNSLKFGGFSKMFPEIATVQKKKVQTKSDH